jgi:hypothetical protein
VVVLYCKGDYVVGHLGWWCSGYCCDAYDRPCIWYCRLSDPGHRMRGGCAYWYRELHKEIGGSAGKRINIISQGYGWSVHAKVISNIHIEYITADTFVFVDYFIWSKHIHHPFWFNCWFVGYLTINTWLQYDWYECVVKWSQPHKFHFTITWYTDSRLHYFYYLEGI